MSVSPQLYGGNCCCIGSQHGAVVLANRYGWLSNNMLSIVTPASAAEVRSKYKTYLRQVYALESGTPAACIAAVLPAQRDIDPRTGQITGTDLHSYMACDGQTRVSSRTSTPSSTETIIDVYLNILGTPVWEFSLRETISVEFDDELMEDILDEIVDEVDWSDVLLFDDAHQCHAKYQYDDAEDVDATAVDSGVDWSCSGNPAKALRLVCSGVAFYALIGYEYGWNDAIIPTNYAPAWNEVSGGGAGGAGPYSFGAKWSIHSRSMREKRSTRNLTFDTQVPPIFYFGDAALTPGLGYYGSPSYGTASDTSSTSCAIGDWIIDAPDGGTLGYPLSAFTVVARGTLAADLGY